MKKLLFLHGFFASGQCEPAMALRMAFDGRAQVVSPDLPTHPVAALKLIRDICDSERPDVLVGNSCGAFYAQILAPIVGVPALLGNPHFRMTEFLKQRIGVHTYKSERKDGKQSFEIDEQLVDEFAEVEFRSCLGIVWRARYACPFRIRFSKALRTLVSFSWRAYANSRRGLYLLCASCRKVARNISIDYRW